VFQIGFSGNSAKRSLAVLGVSLKTKISVIIKWRFTDLGQPPSRITTEIYKK